MGLKQKTPLIICLLLLAPLILAATSVQISPDNQTWRNVTNTRFDGVINEDENSARVHYLNTTTKYYLRAKDTNTNWTYKEFTTQKEANTKMNTAIIASLIAGVFAVTTLFMIVFRNKIVLTIGSTVLSACFMAGTRFAGLIIEATPTSEFSSSALKDALVLTLATQYQISMALWILVFAGSIVYYLYLVWKMLADEGTKRRLKSLGRQRNKRRRNLEG